MKPNTELNSTSPVAQLPQTREEGSSKRRTTSSYTQRRDGTRSKRDFFGNFAFTSPRPSYSPRNRFPRLVQSRYDPSVPEPEVNSRIPQALPSGRGLNGKNNQTIEQRLKVPRGIPTIAGAVTSTRPAVIQLEDRAVIAPSLGPLSVPPRWQEKVRYIQDWIRDTHQAANNCSDEANHPSPSPPRASMRHEPLCSSPLAICIPGAQPPMHSENYVVWMCRDHRSNQILLILHGHCFLAAFQRKAQSVHGPQAEESIRRRLTLEYTKQTVERRRAELELQVAKVHLSSAETRRRGTRKTLKLLERGEFGIDYEKK
ncbi:hypothetical protein EV421DRAFT_1902443 [Armillaria borealis]|uniref:Uncharacterized protein n=1 Tax=Armillaria borealis TaxID=47425 RepID=A0AA39MIJ3_9AGAR|nr:hypothetical protein EV421DRAFT_1285220 [Armillaria borealis]KAK0445488.1 hypothetical protein EV421DRAFT_1902443 [Armillaria borealis]